jgi:hypothetical protein
MADCGISGVIRGGIYMVVPAIVTIICYITIAIVMIPYDFYKSYSIVFKSKMIGFNVRILLFLSLWIPIVLWLPLVSAVVCIGAPIGYFGFAFIETYSNIYNKDTCCLLETEIFGTMQNAIYDFWNFNYRVYGSFVDEINDPRYNGHVYEISIIQIIFGLILGIIGMVINLICTSIIMILKCVPAILRFSREITSGCCQLGGGMFFACFPLWLVIIILMIVVCIGAIPVLILIGMIKGVIGPIGALYKSENICVGFANGFKDIFHNIYQLDLWTNELIFGDRSGTCLFGCFSNCNPDYSNSSPIAPFNPSVYSDVHPQPSSYSAESSPPNYTNINLDENSSLNRNERVSVLTIWNNFFAMCEQNGLDALLQGLCTKDDIIAIEPYIIIGLPSLVIVKALERSKNKNALVLSDGIIITKTNCPDDMISKRIYSEFMSILNQFNNLKLSQTEYAFVEKWLFTVGDEDKCKHLIDAINTSQPQRLTDIKKVTSQIQSIATSVSRLPPYHRNFYASLIKILSTFDGSGV